MFITCGVCSGQNFVPNPSFEDTVQCPNAVAQLNTAVGWSDFKPSPDNFNSCNNSAVGVPNNVFGSQLAHTGNAYAGFTAYYPGNARECLGIQLIQPLVIGIEYFVSFYVSGAHSDIISVGGSCNKLGAKFSTVPYSISSPIPIDNISHAFTNTVISDTLNWVFISGSFIADSAYQFLCIGNFFDNASTTFVQYDTLDLVAYYYVDDIVVSTDSLTTINETTDEPEWYVFPNPFTDKINITTKRNEVVEISFYDVTARKILNQSFTNSISINAEQLAKGIYLYEVRNKYGVIKKGKVVKD